MCSSDLGGMEAAGNGARFGLDGEETIGMGRHAAGGSVSWDC